MKYTVHKTKPAGFVESVAVAACYIEFGGDYLCVKEQEVLVDQSHVQTTKN